MSQELQASVTCPACGHVSVEAMPTDRCVFFFDCRGCGAVLRPKPGDCCVFCSYGDRPCPSVQQSRSEAPAPDQPQTKKGTPGVA